MGSCNDAMQMNWIEENNKQKVVANEEMYDDDEIAEEMDEVKVLDMLKRLR